MAAFKFGLVIFCALFLSQVSSTPAVADLKQNQLANETEHLIKLVTKFLGVVIDDLDFVTTNLTGGGMDAFQKKTMDVTFKVLGEVKKFLDNEFDRIYSRVNKNAQVITTCLKAHGNPLIKVVVSFYNQTTICFNPALIPVLRSVKPLLADLKQVDSTVANLAPGLENCSNDLCVFGVLAKVAQQILKIPDILQKDIPAITPLLKTLVSTALSCAKKYAAPWRTEFIQVFNSYSNCVRAK